MRVYRSIEKQSTTIRYVIGLIPFVRSSIAGYFVPYADDQEPAHRYRSFAT